MYRVLDLDAWNRKDHFHFFRQFEEPFFGVCITIDVTRAYEHCKGRNYSFFLYYLHASLVAANSLRAFRLRIEGDEVWEYDAIHASPTINRPDGTFGFAYMDFVPDFEQFAIEAQREVARVRQGTGLELKGSNANVVHFSSLPWVNFTGLSHARSFTFRDCIPKISFGKMTENAGLRSMPVSIHVHHALADGSDVGLWIEALQAQLDGRV
jgi:chloramphenicol O-acetyltransferase type A